MSESFLAMLTRRATEVGIGATLNFAALDDALQDTRIIMLGEQSHGDGAAFALKAKLVEHLHLHHNFDVLAFEADFFFVNRAWDAARTLKDLRGEVAPKIYPFWVMPTEMQPLWRFIEARFDSGRPLVVAGIDPRHAGKGTSAKAHELIDAFEAFANGAQLELTKINDYSIFRSLLEGLITQEYMHRVSAFERKRFFEVLRQLLSELPQRSGDEASFWRQELLNLSFAAHNAWGFERRDEGMAANLLWLAEERYPNGKIIVWAHNYHIAKSSRWVMERAPSEPNFPFPHDTLLGDVAARSLGKAVFALGVISGGGIYHPYAFQGDFKTLEAVLEPAPDSLEQYLYDKGHQGVFINFRDADKADQAFVMSGIEHNQPALVPWGEVFDGVFFIREMKGLNSVRLSRKP